MSIEFIPRSLEPVLLKAAGEFPAVVLVGPRQSGKTTLLSHLFGGKYSIVSLEPPDVRLAAQSDPRGFLHQFPAPVIFDEIQYAPILLPYIKEAIDSRRSQPGQYILTGSQNLLLMSQVSKSLAGRAAILKLMPLTRREITGAPGLSFPWEGAAAPGMPLQSPADLWWQILRGSYPELAANPERDAHLWQADYIQTYLERDVRNLRNLGDLTQFQLFLRALAARSTQILNLSDLARDVGIAVNTAKSWISILEASFLVFILRPYYANIGKRLIKSPKVYFMDTGLLCYLVGLRDVNHAVAGPMGGAIFENWVVSDLYKTYLHRGEEPAMYFWRTAAGSEVDIIIDTQAGLVPIEVKLSQTPRPEMAVELHSLLNDLKGRALPGFVIHPGNVVLPMGEGVTALPVSRL
ncbi:predicted ATPase [Longilinea arvoryzae]|uniref:Predicted ATPase n=1 Tax=Longilinea arvoryzae TaxID=360412 RepID=A0A0S7BF69_9CHLR|nr:ATP-binding protein [Longilinea arvoryzae]GAP12674.1 predicted ATPase [Longilinea arvoryzae]